MKTSLAPFLGEPKINYMQSCRYENYAAEDSLITSPDRTWEYTLEAATGLRITIDLCTGAVALQMLERPKCKKTFLWLPSYGQLCLYDQWNTKLLHTQGDYITVIICLS